MNFSGKGFVVEETTSKPGKSIKPGVVKAKISSVEYFEGSEKKTPGFRLTIETPPVEGLTNENNNSIGQVATTTFWMSEGAWDIEGKNWCTKARMTILADKLGVTSEFDAITSDSAEGFVKELSKIFVGKVARFAVGGEWQSFEGDNGTIKFIKPNLITFKFVESTKDVPNDADTELSIDLDNEYHVKPLEVADDTTADSPFVDGDTADVDWD